MKIYLVRDLREDVLHAAFTKEEAVKLQAGNWFTNPITEHKIQGEATIWMVIDTAITNIYFISFDEREARAFHRVNGFVFSEVISWPVPYRYYDHEQYRLPTQEEIDATDLEDEE